MQKKKPVLPNAKALLNQWKTGPIADKVLTPGHGRGVKKFINCFISSILRFYV